MKFGVVIFPGSNCDMDIVYVLGSVLEKEVVKLWHKDTDLQECDFIILPGGFSFGDYLRSGAIAKFSPIMKEIIGFANAGGFVMGICNGFQILCETGLLPGVLLHNTNHKFICKNVHLKTISEDTILTNMIGEKAIKIPIAHGEGRYLADEKAIEDLENNDQILFKYCNEKGEVTADSNPNGSIKNIAGVCNKDRNVFGMMPHPERASDIELKSTNGRKLFESILSKVIA